MGTEELGAGALGRAPGHDGLSAAPCLPVMSSAALPLSHRVICVSAAGFGLVLCWGLVNGVAVWWLGVTGLLSGGDSAAVLVLRVCTAHPCTGRDGHTVPSTWSTERP